jgi:hypothetical protein
MSLKDLVQRAYGRGDALQLSRSDLVTDGPNWSDANLYDIDAKPGQDPLGLGRTGQRDAEGSAGGEI